jgi:hypothetical protein
LQNTDPGKSRYLGLDQPRTNDVSAIDIPEVMGFGKGGSGDRAEEKLKVLGHLAEGKLRSAQSWWANSLNWRIGMTDSRANSLN